MSPMPLPAPYDGPLPILAGMSPFQIKGLSFLTIIEEANQHVPGGFAALRESLSDRSLVRFFEQTFLAMSYYDALPVIPLSIAYSRLRGIRYGDSVRERAELRAQHDLKIYRSLLRGLSPDQMFGGLSRVFPRYFSFGRAAPRCLQPGHWELVVTEIPALLAPWFAHMAMGYIGEILRAAGVAKPVIDVVSMTPLSTPPGLEPVELSFEIHWDVQQRG